MKRPFILLLVLTLLTSFAPHKELSWTAIGDSITYMNGKPELCKHRISKGYLDCVTDKLPYIHSTNQGHSGWTAKGIADSINKLGLVKSDVYTVFLGTNDWGNGIPIGTISDYDHKTGNKTEYGAYRTIIDKLRSLNSDAKIIMMTPLQRTDFTDLNNPLFSLPGEYADKNGIFLYQYADVVKTIAAAEQLQLVDLYYKSGITPKNAVHYRRLRDPKTGEYKNYTYPESTKIAYNPPADDYPYPIEAMYMTYDGLHPSDKGHRRIAGMLIKVMKKY